MSSMILCLIWKDHGDGSTDHSTSYGVKVIGVSANEKISVYTIDGALQQSVRADNSVVEIPLQKNCVYIIKVGAKAIKLRL